jgi:hypothetical protein
MTSDPSPVIATMVDIEELDEYMSPEGALAYLDEFVFPKETDILLSFFEYNGIEDLMTSCLLMKKILINIIVLFETLIYYYLCLVS